MTEEKIEMIQKQVIAKVHWGAREQEVLEWLREKGIEGDEARRLLDVGNRAREKDIRGRAVIGIVLSILGMAIGGGFVVFQLWSGIFVIGYGSILLIGVGLASVGAFVRNLWRLLSGKTSGPID